MQSLRRFPWLPLLVVIGAMIGVIVDVTAPGAASVSATLRATALGSLLSLLAGGTLFALQAGESRRQRRHDVLRAAYTLLLKAADRIMALDRELQTYPKGRSYVGTVSGATVSDEFLRHNPFAHAEAIEAEAERLHADADAAIVLENGADNPVLRAWGEMITSYYMCAAARRNDNEKAVIEGNRRELQERSLELRDIAYVHLGRL